jgi:Putative restriction endonuclease
LIKSAQYTSSSVNKQAIYSALGVPELWRYTKKTLLVYRRVEEGYELSDHSLAFPCLPIAEVANFIEQSRTVGQRSAVRLFCQRIREILDGQNG